MAGLGVVVQPGLGEGLGSGGWVSKQGLRHLQDCRPFNCCGLGGIGSVPCVLL